MRPCATKACPGDSERSRVCASRICGSDRVGHRRSSRPINRNADPHEALRHARHARTNSKNPRALEPRHRRTPAWLLSQAGGSAEPAKATNAKCRQSDRTDGRRRNDESSCARSTREPVSRRLASLRIARLARSHSCVHSPERTSAWPRWQVRPPVIVPAPPSLPTASSDAGVFLTATRTAEPVSGAHVLG